MGSEALRLPPPVFSRGQTEAGQSTEQNAVAAPYRGPDRRASGATLDIDVARRQLLLAGVLLLAIYAAAQLIGSHNSRWTDPVRHQAVDGMLSTSGLLVSLAATWMCAIRWRVVDDSLALRTAVALPLLFVGSASFDGVIGLFSTSAAWTGWAQSARFAAALVASVIMVSAVLRPTIDAALSPLRFLALVFIALAALGLLTAGLHVSRVFAGSRSADRTLPLAFMWGVLGAAMMKGGFTTHRPLRTWLGLSLFGVSLGQLASSHADHWSSTWPTTTALFGFVAMLLATVGIGTELRFAYQRQQGRLFELQVLAAIQAERIRIEHRSQAERRHDQRAAFLAIEGAVRQLERDNEIDHSSKRRLSAAVTDELARLRRAVDGQVVPSACHAIALRETLTPVVECARAKGSDVKLEIPSALIAFGDADGLANVVQNLVENAHHHAHNRHIRVSATTDGGSVTVRVEDDGPGVPEPLRRVIFDRGVSSKGQNHSGLGLFIARRTMREMGGDLTIDDDRDRGACFVATLPAPDERSGPQLG